MLFADADACSSIFETGFKPVRFVLINYNAFSLIRTRDLGEIRRMFADGERCAKTQEYETTCNFTKIVIQLFKTNPRNEVSIVAEKKEKQYVSDNARLLVEWDWEKNSQLGFHPSQTTQQSNKKVWWKCQEGHRWQADRILVYAV